MDRAYALLVQKGINEERRILTGFATTPSTDRVGDVVEPLGAKFDLPLPFLWAHDATKPVGHVTKAKVTPAGIEVEVQIAKVDEPGVLKDRVDEAWHSIRAGLVRGLSIGFSGIEATRIESGKRYVKWLWLELSAVAIAANGQCSIQNIKSLDRQVLREASHRRGGVPLLSSRPIAAHPGAVRLLTRGAR